MNSIPKVKICGITNPQDAQVAISAGADALGFVFFSESPRFIQPRVARQIIAHFPPFVIPVGIFVNAELNVVQETMQECGLALAQLHGDETPEYCETLHRPVIRGIRLKKRGSLLAMADYKGRAGVRGFIVDAYSKSAYGGTGITADWDLAAEAAEEAPIILAGGLTPDNVQEAIQKVKPHGVDVSSGVEASPGKKDPVKVQAFIQAVKLVT